MDVINQIDDKLKRKRELTNARVRKYRRRKHTEESQRLNSSMQDDSTEEMQNKQVEEDNAERKKVMARECSRRYRENKRLNVLQSVHRVVYDSQIPGPPPLVSRNQRTIKVQSRDEHSHDAVQDCERQSTMKVERTKQYPVFQIQGVPFVEIVPISENRITQEIEEACVTPDTDDKYDVLGKYVASKVRQLDIQQRMYVERIIHEAIYEGQMGHLNDNSQLVVNTETFVSSQGHDRKRLRLEVAEVKVEREDELETQETGPDLEEKSAIEDENESCSYFACGGVKRKCLKTPEHLTDVANIKLEIETEENEYLPGNSGAQYYETDTQNSTIHGSHYSDDAKRKKNNETHPELQGFKLKTEIDIEENWNPQETHLDNVSKFETEIELSKIKRETDDGLG